jgi:hypothetical protein
MPRPNRVWHGPRRASLLVVAAIALILSATPATADNPPPIPASANWQTTVNFYRAMAGLAGVGENTTWNSGEVNHSRYVAENHTVVHAETPGNPYYTADGDTAGQNGNVAIFFQTPPPVSCPDRTIVELWMAGPFHAIGIVDPRLAQSAFGKYISVDNDPGRWCGATLDVIRGLTGPASSSPVYFPRNGTTTPLLQFDGGEFPDPLASCPGFSPPTGPAILLQLTANPGTSSATLKDNGSPVTSCSYNENTYTNPDGGLQSLGRAILAGRHAIVVMPRFALTSGHTYTVEITSPSPSTSDSPSTLYTWNFMACAGGQTGGSCFGPTAVVVRAASATRTHRGVLVRWRTTSEAQALGFNVYRLSHGMVVKLNRALIPSVFGGTTSGHAYSWLDRRAPRASSPLRYRLQSVSLDGTRRWVGGASFGQ